MEDGPTSSPATEYLDVSLSDHASLTPLAVHDTPQVTLALTLALPLLLLLPLLLPLLLT